MRKSGTQNLKLHNNICITYIDSSIAYPEEMEKKIDQLVGL